jgi:hypothetical protein
MIDKLEFLLYLAREKHFGRAAEAAGVRKHAVVGVKARGPTRHSNCRATTVMASAGASVLNARKLVSGVRTMRRRSTR